MLGETGLLNAMREGSTYIDVSTIDPQTARKLANAAETAGVKFLECPLGKTPAHAEKAEEPIFIGGEKEVFDEMKEVLEIVGDPLYCMGEV
jgi:3-hydroxyisobutyrate dehydrogenase-like beta-hydroxyacid dehydrogenase